VAPHRRSRRLKLITPQDETHVIDAESTFAYVKGEPDHY